MSKKIIFELGVVLGINYHAKHVIDFEVDAEDLEGVPRERWEEVVRDELGGEEALSELYETWCTVKKE